MISPVKKHTPKTMKILADVADSSIITSNMEISDLFALMLKDKQLQDIIKTEVSKEINDSQNVTIVKSILSEYFRSFILLGYGLDGNRTVIEYTPNEQDADSLIEFMRSILSANMK